MRPLQHKCPGDDKERRQTINCQNFHPNTGYHFHLMYAYITQGRPDRGLLRLTPRAQTIITQGIGVPAAPLLQPPQITARTAQENRVYVYHPTAIARLPIPSDTDIIYFTDASGTTQGTPMVGRASTWNTTPGPPSLGRPPTANCAPWQTPSPPHHHPQRSGPCNIWVVVDATVDIHLTRRLADLPLHKALESGLTTQVGVMGGLQGHAPPGRPTHRQTGVTPLHIRQWTRRHAGQTPEHGPHPRARTRTTRHCTPQPPAAPAPDTLGHTDPPMDTRGHALHRSRQAVPLPHTHPGDDHDTGPPSEHRTPPTP